MNQSLPVMLVSLLAIYGAAILPADQQKDEPVRTVAEQFLKAMAARNMDEAVALAEVPLVFDDHKSRVTIETKDSNVKSRLARGAQGWEGMEVSRILTLEEAMKNWQPAIKARLQEVLKPTDHVVILSGKSGDRIDLYVRTANGIAKVIGFSTVYQAS